MYKIILVFLIGVLSLHFWCGESFYTGGSDIKIDNVARSTSFGDRLYLIEFDHAPNEITVCFDFNRLMCYAVSENEIAYTDM